MPEIRIKRIPTPKEANLTVVRDKGGIFMTEAELEYVKFAESEYSKLQNLLRSKLHQHGKVLLERVKTV